MTLLPEEKAFPPCHDLVNKTNTYQGMRTKSCRIKNLGKPADLGKLERPQN